MKFIAGKNAIVPNEFYDKTKNVIAPYIDKLNEIAKDSTYSYPESSIYLPSDYEIVKQILRLVKKKKTRALKYIFLCGIGGSNLGTKALYESWYLLFDNLDGHKPKIIFVDTVNSQQMLHTLSLVAQVKRVNDFLLIGVTKSGTTTETVTNIEILTNKFSEKFGKRNVYKRMLFITDEGSILWKEGEKKKISLISIPKKVGGRFSVFSAVGLLPLELVDISSDELLARARGMREWCLHSDLNDNPAFASATIIMYHLKKGKNISNTFFFNTELESVGKWYRQLVGESLGKKVNNKGEEVYEGITPINSVGSTDLHSVAQLYLGGPKDKITTFVKMSYNDSPTVPNPQIFSLLKNLEEKSMEEIMDAIYEGTKRAYINEKLPFIEVIIENLYDVAAFMQFKMIEVMLLGYLLDENTFNQPSVELYKEETKKILGF